MSSVKVILSVHKTDTFLRGFSTKSTTTHLLKIPTCDFVGDFYIGGSDSCTGDSGGPMWVYERLGGQERAVAVGIVSRGDGCAKVDSPGIYTRISKFTGSILY